MRRTTLAITMSALLLGFAGCSSLTGGVYDAPLPGGADVGDAPIHLNAEFGDVLDLVPQSSVKVDNVAVGRVTDIGLAPDGHTAQVELLVRGDLGLPAGTTARVQQTSLLGEKYVALLRPTDGGEATAADLLEDGDQIQLDRTDAAAEAEQVLGALSMVLNGGGIGQFQEISRELQAIGDGRTDGVRDFIDEMHRFVTTLDRRRDSITTAIDGLAALSATLDADKEQIASALDGLSPGLQVLADQRPQLVKLLAALDKLSTVTVDTLDKAADDIVADFDLLAPILRQLAKAGNDLPMSLEILLTYPFPDAVLGAIRGDYLNVFLTTNFRTLPSGCTEGGCQWPQVRSRSADGARAQTPSPREPLNSAPSPTMLPPTDSPMPGLGTTTVPGPSIVPTDTASGTGPGTPSSPASPPSGTTSGVPSGTPGDVSGATATPEPSNSATGDHDHGDGDD